MTDPTKERTLVQSMVRGDDQFHGPESVQRSPDEQESHDEHAVEQQAHRRPSRGLRASPEPFCECTSVEQGMGRRQETTRATTIFDGIMGFQRLFIPL